MTEIVIAQTSASGANLFLGFIETFNLIIALVALYFAVRILPSISRDVRKRSWLFLSLSAITFAAAETIGAVKEIGNIDLEVFYESTEAVFVILFAIGFYSLFTSEYKETLKLRRQSTVDDLTGLYSSAFFHAYLLIRVNSLKSAAAQLTILLVSVDDFKHYKKEFGEHESDYLLRKISGIIQEEVGGDDVVSRDGEEQFSLMLASDFDSAAAIAESIRSSVRLGCSTFADSRIRRSITVSIGLSTFGRDAAGADRLLHIAAARLNEAVRRGRNQVYAGKVDLPEDRPQTR